MRPSVVSTTKLNWSRADRDYKHGQQLIKQGDWANGFKLHELRALPDVFWGPARFTGPRTYFDKAPIWMPGQSVKGRDVIVWSEAGWGDLLQFSRFIPLLKQAGASKVTLVYPKALHGMMKRLPGIDKITDQGREVGPSSYRIKTMSLPYLLMESNLFPNKPVDKIYGSEGVYRNPDIYKAKGKRKKNIGLFWNTSNTSWNMKAKQIPDKIIEQFVAEYGKKYNFVSLQVQPTFMPQHLDSSLWHNTADKIQLLDAVISVDSSVAHCAASVGTKTINLIGDESVACWRWYPKGVDTYWYDSMKCVWWDDYSDWNTGLTKALEMV